MRSGEGNALEVWGGIECSHVLIRGEVRDQCLESGHDEREGDLDLVAGLGIRTLRTPLLWAKAARERGFDFVHPARRLDRMRELGIRPIVGFVHHGSGPGGLEPDDPAFAQGLGDYAEAAASRFPWIERFTPLNEPVTTTRFGYLYGHWHPHERCEARFLRAILGSAVATAEAMRRIRRRVPTAELIQTEDLGRVFSVPALADQAAYENERRYLFFDLLAGRVDRAHRFHSRLIEAGAEAGLLDRLVDEPCPPDIVGLNYYLTSDRFLDDRVELYPEEEIGGNGRQRYVDIAASRVDGLEDEIGPLPAMREAFARYGRPIALTEVHNGCTREEQLRWLIEAWEAARMARAEGIPVPALTIWALFGSLDWASLLTDRRGLYESGAFDTRTDPPRPTAVARAIEALASYAAYRHPVLEMPGWWRKPTARAAPCLRVLGEPEMVGIVSACCGQRRIPICSGAYPGSPVWGELAATGHRFRFRPVHGPPLEVEAPVEADPFSAAHAALDLAIDGEAGRFRLDDLRPPNQYVARRILGGEALKPARP